MNLNFDIPTPETCVDCPFHFVATDGRYGPWILQCLVDKSIKISPKDGTKMRNPNCPGTLEDEAK